MDETCSTKIMKGWSNGPEIIRVCIFINKWLDPERGSVDELNRDTHVTKIMYL